MMEESNLVAPELNQADTGKIYSKRAVMGFTIFFAPLFGGVLLHQNLIDHNKKMEANLVLFVSIVFTLITIVVVNSLNTKTSSFTYILNIVWGAILSEYFYKKYFPDDNYEYKKIWKALIISIIIMIPFVLAMIYSPAD